MTKFLMSLSLLSLLVLGTGAFFNENPFAWLTTSGLLYQYARIVLVILLSVLLMTTPPRYKVLRFVSGITAALLAVWTLQQSYTYQMEIFDTLAFLGASITLFVTALERKLEPYSIHGLHKFHRMHTSH